MEINHRRGHIGVPQQILHGPDVDARLQQVGGEAMAERVGGGPLGNAGAVHGGLELALKQFMGTGK